MRENYSHLSGEALLNVAVQENVLVQLEHLRSHPALVAAIARGELNLHGWVYKIETGDIFAYDAAGEQFLPIGETAVAELAVAADAV
jgi:carbonic anhydrase